MFNALTAAISNAIEVVQSKYLFSRYHVPAKTYVALNNFFVFIATIIPFAIWGEIYFNKFSLKYAFAFVVMIIVAYFGNILYYYGLKRGKICDVEPLVMTSPLVTMVLAAIVYPDERNLYILVPAIIASLLLAYSRIERHHLKINKYSLAMIGFVALFAIESNLIKYILDILNPVALYTIRIGILSSLFLLFLRPKLREMKGKVVGLTFLNGAIVALEYIFSYTAVREIGVIATNLIFLIAPVMILLISNFIFKEKMGLKKAISDTLILICIAVAILIK